VCRAKNVRFAPESGHSAAHQACPLSANGRPGVASFDWLGARTESEFLYNLRMNESFFTDLSAWLTQAGLADIPETEIVSTFCDRCVAAGIPLGRAHLAIDTLHPVHEGRLFRWGYGSNEPPVHEYGRTSLDVLDGYSPVSLDAQATGVSQRSPFYHMLQSGASLIRRRLNAETKDDFSMLADRLTAGITDYVAITTRFAAEGVIGEMDAVYSSWGTKAPEGFNDGQIATLKQIVPYLALAIKSVSLARMTRTLMETYLGRDAGQRVLSGRIVRGVAERIDAVVWFSDLRGFTLIPLLNDYSDVIISAIHERGGDVLKLIGDGTLAIFTAENRSHACNAALSAANAAREGVAELNKRRAAKDIPVSDMYLGLHVGKVFYGNVGSRERLDFTVVGPAVNEASRIAAMCRSLDQPVLISAAFASVGDIKSRLVSVGRYALRGVAHPQELFTLEA
jgi:adenylate cyclase